MSPDKLVLIHAQNVEIARAYAKKFDLLSYRWRFLDYADQLRGMANCHVWLVEDYLLHPRCEAIMFELNIIVTYKQHLGIEVIEMRRL